MTESIKGQGATWKTYRVSEALLDRVPNADQLVILFHAYTSTPEKLDALTTSIRAMLPAADIVRPKMPMNLLSRASLPLLTKDCLKIIDYFWNSGHYHKILLIGHSLGALIARKVYVAACGEDPEAPFEFELRDEAIRERWVGKVERVILLAGTNNGWKISHHFSLRSAILWTLGSWLGGFLRVFGWKCLIFETRRGAPFLTALRLQWLAMRQNAKATLRGNALTIQLLGSVDDLVSPEDNVDLITGQDFVYLDVPKSGHVNVIEMNDPIAGSERRAVLQQALLATEAELQEHKVPPSDLPLGRIREDVTDVIFVIHGIRDVGYWTQKIARKVRQLGNVVGKTFATITSSYGYFPMLPFLWPSTRRAKLEWFMDRYAEAKALYPNAKFSFVGHSNGTYLLARALQQYPVCKFEHVVFVGSVVVRKYPWHRLIKSRVVRVLNFVASWDWVVAWFPKTMQTLHLQDLGSAGHDGFDDDSADVINARFVRGAHSAARTEANWDTIATFIASGSFTNVPEAIEYKSGRQPCWIRWSGTFSVLIWILILFLLGAGAWAIWHSHMPERYVGASLVVYCLVIWKILTRL